MSNEIKTRLNAILATIDDTDVREDLFMQFWLVNPLEFASLLHSLEISDAAKSQLLALKVGQPPQHKGTDLSPLIERAIEILWQKLADDARAMDLVL